MRIIICLGKSEVSVERISFCDIIKNFAEHDIHCLPCFDTNDVIDLLPKQLSVHIDVKVTSSRCDSAKALSATVSYSIVAMVTNV